MMGKRWERHWREACRPGERVLIPRAAIGNRELIEEMQKTEDLVIDDVATYDTMYESSALIDEKAEFENGRIDLCRIYQRFDGEGLCTGGRGTGLSESAGRVLGKQTKAAADALGMEILYGREGNDGQRRGMCGGAVQERRLKQDTAD